MLYVAYGSNMDMNQMAVRCPHAKLVGLGEIKDYRLMYKSHFATIEPDKETKVPVVIWDINKRDEDNLDFYEGFPHFYYKVDIPVIFNGLFNGKIQAKKPENIAAMVYIMREHNPYILPSTGYYDNMLQCYNKFGFATSILDESVAYTKRHIDEQLATK